MRDTKPELPIHVILGASDYVKIKIQKCPRVGEINEPIAEQTKMGWIIISLGRESDLVSSLYTRTSEWFCPSVWYRCTRSGRESLKSWWECA